MQLELDATEYLFMLNTDFETPYWLTSLWQGLSRFNIQIRLSQDIIRSAKQRNDRSIAAEAFNNGFPMDQIIPINRVKIALGILFVSDLLVPG